MAFLTLISDYGQNSYYVAAIKGTLYTLMPDLTIVDVSHQVKPHDVLQSAFILKNAAKNFPAGTVHLICVDTSFDLHGQYLIAKSGTQLFIGADNGVFSLLFMDEEVTYYAVKKEFIKKDDLFPDKNVFAPLAVKLLSGTSLLSVAEPGAVRNIKQHIAPVEDADTLRGSIVFVDGYDNAITNISKSMFERRMEGKAKFAIFYRGKQKITSISKNYHDVKGGKELALFNESGYLEISMNAGQARSLLGLQPGGQVIVEFYE